MGSVETASASFVDGMFRFNLRAVRRGIDLPPPPPPCLLLLGAGLVLLLEPTNRVSKFADPEKLFPYPDDLVSTQPTTDELSALL